MTKWKVAFDRKKIIDKLALDSVRYRERKTIINKRLRCWNDEIADAITEKQKPYLA